jgi:hypothetical protein
VLEKAQRLGKRVRVLENRSELYEDLVLAWQCFLTLNRTRQIGYASPQPIPLSEIVAWMNLHQVDGVEQRVSFARLVAVADAEAMAYFAKETEKRSNEVNPHGDATSSNQRGKGAGRRGPIQKRRT